MDGNLIVSPDCAPGVNQASAQAWAFNYKQLVENVQEDIDSNRKKRARIEDAWDTMRLFQHQSLVFKTHLADIGAITAAQVGDTSSLQTTSPIRTGVGDTMAAASYPANRAIDTSDATVSVAAADVATANASIAAAVANFIQLMQQGIAALQSVLVTSSGGASTPSQTQAKPAA